MTTSITLPEWTEYRKKNGLDPLGMQSSSVATYQRLVPGISNVTLRMRYYGLYAWLCHSYAHDIGDTDPKTWQRYIRRAEALYALIAEIRGGETGVAGVQWASDTLTNTEGDVDFAVASEPGSEEYYLKQAWGAYGAAYASQLYEIGVFAVADGHEIPVPSPEIGQFLAESFADAIGPLGERFLQIHEKGRASRDELSKLSPMAPSEIREDSLECECYRNLLFAQSGLEQANDIERRRTLLLLLTVANQLGGIPQVSDIRWMLYKNLDSEGKPLSLQAVELTDHRMRWWIYQANDLIHIAYGTLFKYSMDLLESYPAGIPLGTLIGETIETIRSTADSWPRTWEQHLSHSASSDPNTEEDLVKVLMREGQRNGICTADGAWSALTLLAVVHKQARDFKQQIHSELHHLDMSQSLHTELNFLDSHSADDFEHIVHAILEQRIIKRHLWVALRKLRYQGDYTFLFESDDGRIRLRAKDGPVFTNPRLATSISFLKDTYLIDDTGLTDRGHSMLVEP
ncbi:MAG TPA: hypothetical protein DCE55_16230 [Planctomycetaceae bacterium]|nr:hypothetical protein [Planctomycetaceae bacterium]|tara:strand:+ start:1135 stop:2676 length:1542 start_codon:yes stop_codon:yes gene_type:complete